MPRLLSDFGDIVPTCHANLFSSNLLSPLSRYAQNTAMCSSAPHGTSLLPLSQLSDRIIHTVLQGVFNNLMVPCFVIVARIPEARSQLVPGLPCAIHQWLRGSAYTFTIYRACLLRLLICCRSLHDMPRILSYAYAPTWYQHIARLALISMEVLNTVIRMSDSVALGHSCLVRSPIVILAGSLQYLPFAPLLLQAILRLSLQDRLCSAHPLQLFCIPGPC